MPWASMQLSDLRYVSFSYTVPEPTQGLQPIWVPEHKWLAVMQGYIALEDLAWHPPYPAIQNHPEVLQLRRLAAMVPPGGKIVECGSYLGGSAKIIAEAAASDVAIYCFDQRGKDELDMGFSYLAAEDDLRPSLEWLKITWQLRDHDRYRGIYDFAQQYLRPHSNVQLIPARVPEDCADWNQPIDMLFEDSSHENPQLSDNLYFWLGHVRSGGLIVGHDYNNYEWPDVKAEADRLARILGSPLIHSGDPDDSVWYIRKP